MNDISVLQDVDPEVLQALCRDSTDDISKALTTTNAATAIGLLKQVMQVSQHCKSVLDGIKDRMYDINKRIGTAQKSVKGYQQRIAEKQQVYNSFTIETQVDESVEPDIVNLTPFDFFSLPKKRDNLDRLQRPIPNFEVFSTVKGVNPSLLREEFISLAPKPITEVHRRASPVPSICSFSNSTSLFASFAQKSIVQSSIRLSESCALFDSLNPPPVQPASSETPSSETAPLGPASVEEKSPSPTPKNEIPAGMKPSPPPPKQASSRAKPSPPPIPKSAIPLQRTTSSSEPSPASVSYRPPADFLAEIRQKGAERMARSSQTQDQSTPSASPNAAQSAPRSAPRPSLPADFLAEIRQKGAERMARSSQTESLTHPESSIPPKPPQSTQSLPQPQSPPSRGAPPRPLPADFLAEIRQKGAARQQAAEKNKLSSQYGTLDGGSATTRRTGTLGSARSLKRYGSSVLNQIHSGQNTLKIYNEGEEPQQPKSGGNPLLDEIRNFDFSRLRKVNKEKPAEKNTRETEEPSLAELMRSRLECFQSDSSIDSDDSRFDFSD